MKKDLEHSFVELLERHQNIIHKVCRLYTNHYDAHNDLFQEITIQLWKAYPKFRGDSKFTTWMYKIVRNLCIDYVRRAKHRPDAASNDWDDDTNLDYVQNRGPDLDAIEKVERLSTQVQ